MQHSSNHEQSSPPTAWGDSFAASPIPGCHHLAGCSDDNVVWELTRAEEEVGNARPDSGDDPVVVVCGDTTNRVLAAICPVHNEIAAQPLEECPRFATRVTDGVRAEFDQHESLVKFHHFGGAVHDHRFKAVDVNLDEGDLLVTCPTAPPAEVGNAHHWNAAAFLRSGLEDRCVDRFHYRGAA